MELTEQKITQYQGIALTFAYLIFLNLRVLASCNLPFESSLLFSLLTVCVVIFYFYFVRRGENIYHIGLLCILVLYLQTVVYPGTEFGRGVFRSWYFAQNEVEFFWGLFIWMVGFLFFSLGLLTFPSPKQPLIEKRIRPDHNPILTVLPLAFFSILGSLLFMHLRGGLDALLVEGAASDSIRQARGLGIFLPLQFMSYVAVAYLGWQAYHARSATKSGALLLTGVLFSFMGGIVPLLSARRGVLFYHFALLILPFVIRLLRQKRTFILLAFLPMIYVDDITSAMRESYYRTHSIDIVMTYTVLSDQSRPVPLSFNHLMMTSALHSRVAAGEFEFTYGSTFLASALNFVPRKLFPKKLWTGGPHLANALSGGYSYSFDDRWASSSMTTGIILETYMNFGVLAVPFVLFLCGYLIARANSLLHKQTPTPFTLTLWSLAFFFAIGVFADDLGGLSTKMLCLAFGLLGLYVCRRLASQLRFLLIKSTHGTISRPEQHH